MIPFRDIRAYKSVLRSLMSGNSENSVCLPTSTGVARFYRGSLCTLLGKDIPPSENVNHIRLPCFLRHYSCVDILRSVRSDMVYKIEKHATLSVLQGEE